MIPPALLALATLDKYKSSHLYHFAQGCQGSYVAQRSMEDCLGKYITQRSEEDCQGKYITNRSKEDCKGKYITKRPKDDCQGNCTCLGNLPQIPM